MSTAMPELLLKYAEGYHKARSFTLAQAHIWWNEFMKASRALCGLFDSYKPEVHYMRGPGPKWRQKHDLPARGINSVNTSNE
jgi:hypothetical protein